MKYESTSYSLTEIDRKIIRREALRRGLGNESAALRLILREWLEFTGQPEPKDDNRDTAPCAGTA